ncbi:hypothetical protein RPHASCH2410_CH12345 [Rhizobium phaseoli Ch24-10]|nr:hypothetical protein RPHASCH2410_CH12345 [Rhizobium phaseoli Ch24-10]
MSVNDKRAGRQQRNPQTARQGDGWQQQHPRPRCGGNRSRRHGVNVASNLAMQTAALETSSLPSASRSSAMS